MSTTNHPHGALTLTQPSNSSASAGEPGGIELLAHLRATGTSKERCDLLEEFLRKSKTESGAVPSAALCVEWMTGTGWLERWHGTVVKAGNFAHGPGFVTNTPGVSAEQELADRLASAQGQIKDLTEQNRELAATNRRLMIRNQFLEGRVSDARLRTSEVPGELHADVSRAGTQHGSTQHAEESEPQRSTPPPGLSRDGEQRRGPGRPRKHGGESTEAVEALTSRAGD